MFQRSPRLPVVRPALFLGCGRKDMDAIGPAQGQGAARPSEEGLRMGRAAPRAVAPGAALPCAVAVILPQRGATAAFDRDAPMSDRSKHRGTGPVERPAHAGLQRPPVKAPRWRGTCLDKSGQSRRRACMRLARPAGRHSPRWPGSKASPKRQPISFNLSTTMSARRASER